MCQNSFTLPLSYSQSPAFAQDAVREGELSSHQQIRGSGGGDSSTETARQQRGDVEENC